MHYCNMSGLRPNTPYYYIFGDPAVGMTPAPYRFVTPPPLGGGGTTPTQTFVVYVVFELFHPHFNPNYNLTITLTITLNITLNITVAD
jgi:hypothetical protein